MKNIIQKPLILVALVGVGLAVAALLVKNRPPLEHTAATLPSKHVEVVSVERLPFRARVTAYGTVEPAILLQSKAEVSGKVSYVHPDLKRGNSIPPGLVVVRIDPEDYEVTLRQTEADLAASRSALTQLSEEEKSTRRSLELARQNLAVGEAELKRVQELWDRRLVARSALDAEQQKQIQLSQQVEQLQGQLNTYASRRASVEAQVERSEQQVKGQQTALGRTEVTVPFQARIGEVSIEQGEFVTVGSTLFEALDINGVEINAQVPVTHMRALVNHMSGEALRSPAMLDYKGTLRSLQLSARVRLVGGPSQASWDGTVLRFSEAIDPTRRTLGVVVGVDRPYDNIIPGQRPPLLKGMYTAVELYGPVQHKLVVPRRAIHNGRVYLATDDERLEIRPVAVEFHQGDISVIGDGLNEGDRLVISDLIPVIEGMPLAVEQAAGAADTLRSLSLGGPQP